MPTSANGDIDTPALESTPSAAAVSTIASVWRRPATGTYGSSAVPIHTPGIEPTRIVAISPRSTLP